jgi:chorismate mutase
MFLRGIRGAVCVKKNTKAEIISASKQLLKGMIKLNNIKAEDVASIIFSTSPDLNAEFPALAARENGFIYTPLLCTHEMAVPGALDKCIRILIHVNTNKDQAEMVNLYLGRAKKLRPDLKK